MQSLKKTCLCIVAGLMTLPLQSFAWGKEGHAIVAEVAMQYLGKTAKKKVMKILDGTSPADAGNWMDEMRNDSAYRYMERWHYINIPKGGAYNPHSKGNVISALDSAFNDLRLHKPAQQQQRLDVLMLFHLIGDLHQPLHTGYAEDKGGNSVIVSLQGKKFNLHHVWDVEIIEDENITLDSVLALGLKLHAYRPRKKIQGAPDFIKWMNESRGYLPQVYDFTGSEIDSTYLEKNKPLVERQLLSAGIRLATVLEQLFSTSKASAR